MDNHLHEPTVRDANGLVRRLQQIDVDVGRISLIHGRPPDTVFARRLGRVDAPVFEARPALQDVMAFDRHRQFRTTVLFAQTLGAEAQVVAEAFTACGNFSRPCQGFR